MTFIKRRFLKMELTRDNVRNILSETLKLLSTPEYQTQLEKSRPTAQNDAVTLLQIVGFLYEKWSISISIPDLANNLPRAATGAECEWPSRSTSDPRLQPQSAPVRTTRSPDWPNVLRNSLLHSSRSSMNIVFLSSFILYFLSTVSLRSLLLY